jgi:hypothetical protein
MSVRKILVSPLRPIGGTGQGVPESKTESAAAEQRRTAGDQQRAFRQTSSQADTTRSARPAPHDALGPLPHNGFDDVEHVLDCNPCATLTGAG